MKRLTIIFVTQLLFTACSVFEPDDKTYYHNVGAEGYVYYQDKPISNVEIIVVNRFKSQPLAVKPSINEYFTSDATGYFYAKFIKRTDHQDVKSYNVIVGNDTLQLHYNEISITPDNLRNSKNNIQLGRLN
jgi:hypothetical protein